MTPSGQTICLCMIVKDEAPVIARCLASARPLVDRWLVVDTGSSDGTQDILRAAMAGVPGELVERPWVDFGHNRSEALALARPHADYSLVVDADDAFEVPAGFAMPVLEADSLVVDIEDASVAYQRAQLFRNALAWRYDGVLHEFPACEEARSSGHLPIVMRRNHDGRRRRDPSTYRNDAAILDRALASETDAFLASRYTFYLAQSWRDCGESEKALAAYLRRAELGYWSEEVFVARLQAARIKEALGHPVDDVLAAYAHATATVPTRAEALHDAARLCRQHGRSEEGYWLARRGVELPAPAAGLFVEPWIYAYGLLDELGVHAYWSGRFAECRDACERLLREGRLPDDMRGRIEANRRFAVDMLAAPQDAGRPAARAVSAGRPRRCAVVTPYFKEDAAVLARCLDSVAAQTIPVDHFVIADGHAQEWVSARQVRHVPLDAAHADYGGTPRAIGSLLAVSEGYDAIAFLDADNWYEPDHVAQCFATAEAASAGCDYVVARSRFVRPDGSVMDLAAESVDEHVDSSCFMILGGAFRTLHLWALMSKQAALVGDRIFYRALRELNLRRAVNETITVNYQSLWESHYRLLGEEPPPGAKPNATGLADVSAWSNALIEAAVVPSSSSTPMIDATAIDGTLVASFYMDNVPAEVVEAQRRIVDRFLPDGMAFVQIRTEKSHPDALDELMRTSRAALVIVLDIDCVPLHRGSLRDLAASASRDTLAGCVQRANHIENGAHLYVGPFCMALSRRLWEDLGRPSFAPTTRGDVGEELSYLCEAGGKSLKMIWPSRVVEPVWVLSPNAMFGFNTEYGGSFLHCFGIRGPGRTNEFLTRCRELLTRCEDEAGIDGGEIAPHAPAPAGSDKAFWHRYGEMYEAAFAALGPVRYVLEIGVLDGESLRWLAARFPTADLVGADIEPQRPTWPTSERITYVQVDQGDRARLHDMFASLDRTYDLLIDDGSHVPKHQADCLLEGLPRVRSGGLYIVEDIHTSHPSNTDFAQSGSANVLHVLLAIEHLKASGIDMTPDIAETLASSEFFSVDEIVSLHAQIDGLHLYRRSHLPMRCYACSSSRFDYRALRCICGADLYSAADSMTFLIRKR